VGSTPEERGKLSLTKSEDYQYLTGGGCTTLPQVDDVEEFAIIKGAMQVRHM
jgi:myosin heavy subunit